MDISILGIKGKKLETFNNKGIYSIEDLVNYLPKKYIDFRTHKTVNSITNEIIENKEHLSIIGILDNWSISKKNPNYTTFFFTDSNGSKFMVGFFHQNYRIKTARVGRKYLIGGVPSMLGNTMIISNPMIYSENIEKHSILYPVYKKIEKISDEYLQEKITGAIELLDKTDILEMRIIKKYNLISFIDSKRKIHCPRNEEDVHKAKERIMFDSLFEFNYKLLESDISNSTDTDFKIDKSTTIEKVLKTLPFNLTSGQSETIENIKNELFKNKKINALVQADVGAGKTLIALLLMTIAFDNKQQACMVAPTSLLAKQHYDEISSKLAPLGIRVGLLTSKLSKKEQNKVIKDINSGNIDIAIGTHSLFSDKITFKNLAISVIDEEHRFGVAQRDSFRKTNSHVISMSATPIPRTLALSLYGSSVKVYTIKSLPSGRQPIDTSILNSKTKSISYSKMLSELSSGKQVYIICPLIEESKSEMMSGIVNVNDVYKSSKTFFEKRGFKVGFVVGDSNTTKSDTEEVLKDFKDNKLNVLIATTIIEVGVNVPNATVITILNAERFGFAQLHQLRGRVGRGTDKSYCYMITDKTDKLDIFTKTTDGFEISREDLKRRGSGAFLGTEQSGNNNYLMLILDNEELNNSIQKDIKEVFESPSRLKRYRDLKKIKLTEV